MDWATARSRSVPGTDRQIVASVGIMAYNEEANIGRLLQRLLDQRCTSCHIIEIIVVASGCTDNTENIVREFSCREPKIKLLVQPRREGKASAVNLFLREANADILVLESADTLPELDTLQRLLEPFVDPEIGMTGAHPVPVNDPQSFMGFATHLMWELHHQIALQRPKLGELVAFRRIFERIPTRSAVDEVSVEAAIRSQGYELRYVPTAVVQNRGPATLGDFLRQRRRIYCGHLIVRENQGYEVATMSGTRVLWTLLRSWRWTPRSFFWVPAAIGLEIYGRFLGMQDFRSKHYDHAVWEIASSTKGAIE